MTIPLPPYTPGYTPVPNVTPFTYRDGLAYVEKLTRLIKYVNRTIVPYVNENYDALALAFATEVQLLIDEVNAAIEEVLSGSVEVQDPVMAAIVNNPASATRLALDAIYAGQDIETIVNSGRLSVASLNAAYASKTAFDALSGTVATISGNYVTEDELDTAIEGVVFSGFSDEPVIMQDSRLYSNGDSFTLPIATATSFPVIVSTDYDMTNSAAGVSSSYDRDTAMRMVKNGPALTTNQFAALIGGVNPARQIGINVATQDAEYKSVLAQILIAASDVRLEHTSAVFTGTWADYVYATLSGGQAKSIDNATGKCEWSPTAGDWFGIGYTFRAGLPSNGGTGIWKKNATVVQAETTLPNPAATALEGSSSADGANGLVPTPVMIPGIVSGDKISVEAVGTLPARITIADCIYRINPHPPIIAVILPGYTTPTGSLTIADATLDAYRDARIKAIADATTAFPVLRGRVVAVDVHQFGWDPAIHTIADGLHPNDAGHRLYATAIEKSIGRLVGLAPLMSSYGTTHKGIALI